MAENLGAATLPDPTFRRLLGEPAWRRLHPAVRARFARKTAPGAAIVYDGTMAVVRCSGVGSIFARLCRLIGTPLAPYRGRDVGVRVELREAADGILWERSYRFPGRAAVRCRSIKRWSPGEGLLECVGRGVGMRLAVSERHGALHFRSTGYFWRLGRWRLAIPEWLSPGTMEVAHADLGGGRFRFTIAVRHRHFGETFFQDGVFEEIQVPWSAC